MEQVAEYLKNGLAAGLWRGEMSGVVALAAELGVNHKTVESALSLLERQGVPRSLRIGLLLHRRGDGKLQRKSGLPGWEAAGVW